MCVLCPTIGGLASYVGTQITNYLGIQIPQNNRAIAISKYAPIVETVVTILALQLLFDQPICERKEFLLEKIVVIATKAAILGTVYSVVTNYFLSLYYASSPAVEVKRCCCKNTSELSQ